MLCNIFLEKITGPRIYCINNAVFQSETAERKLNLDVNSTLTLALCYFNSKGGTYEREFEFLDYCITL